MEDSSKHDGAPGKGGHHVGLYSLTAAHSFLNIESSLSKLFMKGLVL